MTSDELYYVDESDDYIAHSGRPHEGLIPHSGRFPWMSGESAAQHYTGVYKQIQDLKKSGLSEKQIADHFNVSISYLRDNTTIGKDYMMAYNRDQVLKLKAKGYSVDNIASQLNVSGGTVRNMLRPFDADKQAKLTKTIEAVRSDVAQKKYLDIGKGTEVGYDISSTKLRSAVTALQDEGYTIHYVKVPQLGNPGKFTTRTVLAPPGTTYKDVITHQDQIELPGHRSKHDGTGDYWSAEPPTSLSSKRVSVRYAEDGGVNKDGVMEIRPGVADVSLGKSHYAQVRIGVDGTHYLKGMAMYGDPKDFPPGVDVIFNTNKHKGTPMLGDKDSSVLKPMKKADTGEIDKSNPFGATIMAGGQYHYKDKNGKDHLAVVNKVNDEGTWGDWHRAISSQVLSKQSSILAQRQLGLAYDIKQAQFDEINSLTNPVIKKKLLENFSNSCDSDAVHLKAAALPRQSQRVILPFPTMKENEIYAPGYRDGEVVNLIRYPHGGIFEIPTLTVNNKFKPAIAAVGKNPKDMVGINHKVAERLSGADFDGDSVVVIPNKGGNKGLRTSAPLPGLKNFDPSDAYPNPIIGHKTDAKGHTVSVYKATPMGDKFKQKEMGIASNLITDMTIKGANAEELTRATKYSMVVIDAVKHNLDYRRAKKELNIKGLQNEYQDNGLGANGKTKHGSSTLISKAKAEKRINERRLQKVNETDGEIDSLTGKKIYYKTVGPIDPKTGRYIYRDTGATYDELRNTGKINPETGKPIMEKTGRTIKRTTRSTQMAEATDAHSLVSKGNYPMENIYADHANKLKALGNRARKAMIDPTLKLVYSPKAAKKYAPQVESLRDKIKVAYSKKPLERQAQSLGYAVYKTKLEANKNMDDEHKRKLRGQCLAQARVDVGASKRDIGSTDNPITPLEWEAIQSGAITNNMMREIVANANVDKLTELSMPHESKGLSDAKIARAKAMLSNGYTQADIADMLGVSPSTIARIND